MNLASLLLTLAMVAPLSPRFASTGQAAPAAPAQTVQAAPAAPAKRQPPKPAATAAPGGGPDKVWVNTGTSVYHCPGDRYYGKTKDGRYMTEKDARSAGAKGPRGKTCFK